MIQISNMTFFQACSASGNLDLEALKESLAALDKKAKAAADDAVQLQERANEVS